MARRRKKRRRRPRAERRRALLEGAPQHFRLELGVSSLELARAHDGLLRGHPEPVIVIASYRLGNEGVALLGRTIARVRVDSSRPCVVTPFEAGQLQVPVGTDASNAALAIIAVAFEEDSGASVRAAFEDLAAVDDLVLWPVDGAETPTHLSDLEWLADDLRVPRPVALVTSRGPADSVYSKGDDFVSAAAVRLPMPTRKLSMLRFSFRSADSRNDWTAKMKIRY